jgi:hypothetical protein
MEYGYAVYFSYDDLDKQGKLSSDPLQPWKRVAEDMLRIARDYHQVYITVWYPHSFGECLASQGCDQSQHTFDVILQTIIPTRTGLNNIKSTSAVWMSEANYTEPHTLRKPHVYRSPWTSDEHEYWRRMMLEQAAASEKEEYFKH